ncbi:MAG: type III pantothenate kinase [Cyanobacteria bacterium]|nr:type III pantothenate kinase [Cyanobacteriota bacterium]
MTAMLLVDIGNTQTKLKRIDLSASPASETFQDVGSFLTQSDFEGHLNTLIHQAAFSDLAGAIFCSVVPEKSLIFQALFKALVPLCPLMEASPARLASPVNLGSYPLDQLGADRWVKLCAVQGLYSHQSILVMDFGTATTLDYLDEKGYYHGGFIAPGVQTYLECLSLKTAQLQSIPLEPPENPLGKSTQACLQTGLVLGYVEMIEGLMMRVLEQVHQLTLSSGKDVEPEKSKAPLPLLIVVTGGHFYRYQEWVSRLQRGYFFQREDAINDTRVHASYKISPHLVFQGLQIIFLSKSV